MTLPSELRGKKEQSLPVGLFSPGSSNLSRLVKKSGDYQKHPRCKRNLTFDLDLEQSKPQIQIYQKHPKWETGQTGRQVRGAEGTWRGPWGSRPEQCWPHHCWGITVCIGIGIGVNKQTIHFQYFHNIREMEFIFLYFLWLKSKKYTQYFHNIREMEWAIDLALRYNKPVAATMCIGQII